MKDSCPEPLSKEAPRPLTGGRSENSNPSSKGVIRMIVREPVGEVIHVELEKAMSDIDSGKWLEAIRSEMDSMSSNKETYSPIAMAKSIWVLFAISSYYDYEIWKMDVKRAFLNSFIEKEIYMDQPVGFISIGKEQSGSSVVFLVPYADDILLIRNDVKMLGDTKAWLSMQFSMKDLDDASYILSIKIYKDRSRRILGLTQASYIEKVLKRDVVLEGYSNASFQSDEDDAKSQSGFVFKLDGGMVAWKSSK
ncbi:UNVERIFIED_CONTAM: hypothetical protein Slati_2501900 [Sesamum latifolium]|uniref:Reverse transcriptase Ty1/copia-type domain-containing protein n=1 Tax=Sesamum latifolium TaxID=2727402 RepID=A0AAW2WGH8_9LAMI